MRLSDKMTQTRNILDEVYENLGEGITSALNEMFDYGAEAEQTRIIRLLETLRCPDNGVEHDCTDELGGYTVNDVIALIKGKAE